MRIGGTLTKWNDDRGFGYITPNHGGPEVFAHISAFPRDGQRPRLGERVTFEIGTGKDGKKQARNILCPTRPAEKPYRLSAPPIRRPNKPGLLGRLLGRVLPLFLFVLGVYGYGEYTHRVRPRTADGVPSSDIAAPSPFHCDGRQHCSQMHSRAEAEYFLGNCPDTKMDGDHDGIPCENDSRF